MFINLKKITSGTKRVNGRNNQGIITQWHRGGAHKKKYKFVDFFRRESPIIFYALGFEYDATRKGFLVIISSFFQKKQFFSRILLAKNLIVNCIVKNYKLNTNVFNSGSSYYLQDIPVGSLVHNIEKKPFSGGKIVRASGCFGQIIQKSNSVLIKLPSGQLFSFSLISRCSFGCLDYENKKLIVVGKAGRSRWIGIRPTVRGVAMNPVDHPHGGGEGKSQVGRHPVSPWGRLTKGKKTVYKLSLK